MVVKIFTAALVLLVVTAIQLLRSKGRFGCALLPLVGLQVLYCLNILWPRLADKCNCGARH